MNVDDKIIFRIYKPTRTATQSGLGNTRFWHLKIEPESYYIEPLMGWVGSKNPKKQIVIKFDTLEKAVLYAKKCSVKYIIEMPKDVKRRPKSYASNFTKRCQ
ncbi:oxidoreductase [Wolbachia endosymbiont of Litomosoides brasiliensis]|uniref:NADH dehydrogenase ubiquinone Fe-S protein 4 n=1 Tax=Wolbachia endosymbiont of Litomosoides brasiliensis TaxID=1812117 RepID=UPI00158F052E|nr:NADH dehydrogenase ubiquinone Fe-S protein 4 [Wolbachia endosymbiont of Litomosoides brasiliensis]NUY39397.1 oxidoreductase [Wolbachia endosymbiont of Litomosoides brasiliensis]